MPSGFQKDLLKSLRTLCDNRAFLFLGASVEPYVTPFQVLQAWVQNFQAVARL
jgi:hypothetical protein